MPSLLQQTEIDGGIDGATEEQGIQIVTVGTSLRL